VPTVALVGLASALGMPSCARPAAPGDSHGVVRQPHGIWREFCDPGSRWVTDDAFRQQVEAGAAIHLSFDRLEPVHVALGGPGTVGKAQPGRDRSQVQTDPGSESVQFRLVVGFDTLQPAGQFLVPGTTVPVCDLIMVYAGAARSRAW